MIIIKSYIISSKDHTKRFLINNSLPNTIVKSDFCPGVVEGAIKICYNGRSLLNIDDFWGLVDVSWSMILGIIDEFLFAKIGYSEIVECGARFEIMWVADNRCAFTITSYESETIIVPTDMLLKAFLDEGDLFFTTTKAIFGEAFEYDDAFEHLSKLKSIIYDTPQSEWWSLIIRAYVHNPPAQTTAGHDFKPYVKDNRWIYTRNDDAIMKIKEHLSRNALIGLVYIEYKNIPLATKMVPYHIDQFAVLCIRMIMDIVSSMRAATMTYGDTAITLKLHMDRLLRIHITHDDNVIEHIAPAKLFLGQLLSTALNILGIMRDEDYYKIRIAHYQSMAQCTQDLREKIDLLPD